MGMLHQDYQLFGLKQNCQDTVATGPRIYERMQGFCCKFKRYVII